METTATTTQAIQILERLQRDADTGTYAQEEIARALSLLQELLTELDK